MYVCVCATEAKHVLDNFLLAYHRMLVNNVSVVSFKTRLDIVYIHIYMPYHIFTSVCKFRFFSCLIKLNLELVHGCVARI